MVALANGKNYGLAGTLFSRDEARAMRIASRVTAGALQVNCFFVRGLELRFLQQHQEYFGPQGIVRLQRDVTMIQVTELGCMGLGSRACPNERTTPRPYWAWRPRLTASAVKMA